MNNIWSPNVKYNCWRPTYQPELYHHGIKGQKWGVRRFQPYPKGYTGDGSFKNTLKTQGEQIKNYRKYNKAESSLYLNTKRFAYATGGGLAAIGGLVGAATGNIEALPGTAIGGMLVKQAYDSTKAGMRGKEFDKRVKGLKIDERTGLRQKDPSKSWTIEEDLKAVNPEYGDPIGRGANNNCILCSLTYDLRRRGYDVRAQRAQDGWMPDDIKHWYPNIKYKSNSLTDKKPTLEEFSSIDVSKKAEYASKCIKSIKELGDGSRGIACVMWGASGGGHATAFEVQNGKVHMYDPQSGNEYPDTSRYIMRSWDCKIARLDNIEPDPKTIKEVTHK